VRLCGTCLAGGGSMLMSAQSNDAAVIGLLFMFRRRGWL